METWTETDVPGYMVSTEGRMAKLMSTNPGALGYPQFSLVAPGTSGPGIPSKAGASSESEDFSALWGTLGLSNIRI